VSFVYFTDRDLGLRFPEILRNAGLTVERHRDHFPHDAADEEWLAEVGRRGWVAVTHNSRIRYTPNEKEAVIRHGVRLLVIIGVAPYPELAESFVATLHRIEKFLEEQAPPLIAKVYRASPRELARNAAAAGRIECWYPI
jgi:predicted nuclease of predicted toxin-antitoxin system